MGYSFLRHLSRSIYFGDGVSAGDRLIAMFTIYFDASGNKRTDVMTAAGFVSHVKRWERFEKRWTSILKSYSVSEFHMTEFVSSVGEFKHFKGQSELRKTFISELIDCVLHHTKRGFVGSLILSDYQEVNRDYMLAEGVGKPYTVCAGGCLSAFKRWLAKRNIQPSSALVFVEAGDEDLGEFVDRARLEGFKAIPMPKSYSPAFQIGDLVAWKCRTTLTNVMKQDISCQEDADNIKRSLDPVRTIIHVNGVQCKESLLTICSKGPIQRRRFPVAI